MAIRLKTTITGNRELDRALRRLDKKMQGDVIEKAVERSGRVVLRASKGLAAQTSTRVASGLYLSRVKKTRKRGGTVEVKVMAPRRARLGISSDNPYYWPAALEYGAKPHRIVARNQKTLRLLDGTRVRSVWHPGVKPRPFLRPPLVTEAGAVNRIFQNSVRRLISRFNKGAA